MRGRLRGIRERVIWADFWRHTWPRSVAAMVQAVFQRLDIVIVARDTVLDRRVAVKRSGDVVAELQSLLQALGL